MIPTNDQLQQCVGSICKVIAQIPCYHIYERFVASRFDTTEPEVALRAIIHNAALDSALISLRCFNEFFKPDGRKDDVRARHYPEVSLQPFLTSDDDKAIHKYLAHMTFMRSGIISKPWPLDDMVLRALKQGIDFLTIVDARFRLNSDAARAELHGVREGALRVMTLIVKPQTSQ